MSGPKKWVSSKVRGKSSSKLASSGSGGNDDADNSLDSRRRHLGDDSLDVRRHASSHSSHHHHGSQSLSQSHPTAILASSPLDLTNKNSNLECIPPSPPTRLPPASSTATMPTAATTTSSTSPANDNDNNILMDSDDTAFIEFGLPGLSRPDGGIVNGMTGGTGTGITTHMNNINMAATTGSNSSLDTTLLSMGGASSTMSGYGTPSPSTTPPKKTWERNYKSFLKWSGKQHQNQQSQQQNNQNQQTQQTSGVLVSGGGGTLTGRGHQQQQQQQQHVNVNNTHHASTSTSSSATATTTTANTSHSSFGHLPKFNFSSNNNNNSPKFSPKNSPKIKYHSHKTPMMPNLISSHGQQQHAPMPMPMPLPNLSTNVKIPTQLPPPRSLSENNATAHLRMHQQQQQGLMPSNVAGGVVGGIKQEEEEEDLGPSLADGFPHHHPSSTSATTNAASSSVNAHVNASANATITTSTSTATIPSKKGSSLFKAVFRSKSSIANANNNNNNQATLDDSGSHNSHHSKGSNHSSITSRSRLRSKTKSEDALDFTMRRGVDRKQGGGGSISGSASASNTPPGSSIGTNSPRNLNSPMGTPTGTPNRAVSAGYATGGNSISGDNRMMMTMTPTTQSEVEERAAALSRLVNGEQNLEEQMMQQQKNHYLPPPSSLSSTQTSFLPLKNVEGALPLVEGRSSTGDLCDFEREGFPEIHAANHDNNNKNVDDSKKDSLDRPRHRGHTLSSDSKSLFNRVASMGSNLTIREGHEGFVPSNNRHTIGSSTSSNYIIHNNTNNIINGNSRHIPSRSTTMGIPNYYSQQHLQQLNHHHHNNHHPHAPLNTEEEELIRERKKAFTDFHNMGIDSSSAYLGDDPSLHRKDSSIFLSSMAYPAGSAGGKVRTQPTHGINGPHSLDQRHDTYSASTSMSALGMTPHLNETGDVAPERALRPLEGPEHWKKGERHAIIPAILCMCPIQVLNNIMSKDEGMSRNPSNPGTSHGGFGIGSIIAEDDGDTNGWFFAEHHHYPTSGVGGALSSHQYHRGGVKSNVPSSAFGKIILGKATVAALGMRSFLGEVYGWCTGVFVLRQNYLFEFRENDSLNGLPWGYAMMQMAEVYPHKHFTNALHLDFFERPCSKSGKRSLLVRVESKEERDRWVSLLHSAARMTIHDLYDVDEGEGGVEFGRGRYAVVRPAKRRVRRRGMSVSETRYPHATTSHDTFRSVSSTDSLSGCRSSNNDLTCAGQDYDCALKIIDKKEFWSRVKKGRERADTLVREAAVQTTLAVQGADTPGFLRLRSIFETGEQLVMELELLKGTDLFQHISSRGVLDEVEAAHIMRDLLTCLNVMDQIGIAHRDIKPANLLMCDENNTDGTRVKLADYGMSSFVGVDNLVRGRCGTPGFVAPEILLTGVNGGYGNRVDMFSAGVTLYVMLAGYEPFYGESDTELINANREAKVDFPHAEWHTVSIEGRDLIERMLVVDPAKRIGPSEALRHPWITRRAPQNATPCNNPRDFQVACSTC